MLQHFNSCSTDKKVLNWQWMVSSNNIHTTCSNRFAKLIQALLTYAWSLRDPISKMYALSPPSIQDSLRYYSLGGTSLYS
jgi:hypothetical protein